MITFSADQWAIIALIFILGILIGVFLSAGSSRKWKARYRGELTRREELERIYAEKEKEWRERDSLRAAALKDRRPVEEDGTAL